MNFFIVLITSFLLTTEAFSYIGPGLGLGLIGSILGLLLSFFVLIFAIFWFPLKKILKKKKKNNIQI